jgi:hypothetical protein
MVNTSSGRTYIDELGFETDKTVITLQSAKTIIDKAVTDYRLTPPPPVTPPPDPLPPVPGPPPQVPEAIVSAPSNPQPPVTTPPNPAPPVPSTQTSQASSPYTTTTTTTTTTRNSP